MKKKFANAVIILGMAVSLTACGNPMEFMASDTSEASEAATSAAVEKTAAASTSAAAAASTEASMEETATAETAVTDTSAAEAATEEADTAGTSAAAEKQALSSAFPSSLSDDLYSYQVSIGDTVYAFPMTYKDFISQGWTYESDDTVKIPSENYMTSDWFSNGDMKCMAYLVNFGENEEAIADAWIGGIKLDSFGMKDVKEEITFPKGIVFGKSTPEDVEKAYGTPTEKGSTSTVRYTYSQDYQEQVKFVFDSNNGNVLSEADIENLIMPEDAEQAADDSAEASTAGAASAESGDKAAADVPEITAAYKAPKELGDDLLSYTAEYAGDLYALPAPVSAFIDNGWKIKKDETETKINGDGSGKVTMMKDNQKFWTYVRNYSPNATSVENCFVQELKASNNDTNVTLKAAAGLSTGMSESSLKKVLKGQDVSTEKGSDYVTYTIKDNRSLTYGYDIVVRDGKVTAITMKYDPRTEEYLKAMGIKQ